MPAPELLISHPKEGGRAPALPVEINAFCVGETDSKQFALSQNLEICRFWSITNQKCFCCAALKKIHLHEYQYVGELNFKTRPSRFVEKYNAVHKLILDTSYCTMSH